MTLVPLNYKVLERNFQAPPPPRENIISSESDIEKKPCYNVERLPDPALTPLPLFLPNLQQMCLLQLGCNG